MLAATTAGQQHPNYLKQTLTHLRRINRMVLLAIEARTVLLALLVATVVVLPSTCASTCLVKILVWSCDC